MFPRLHINDTDKGGPRPPPRNKMALVDCNYKTPFSPFCNSSESTHFVEMILPYSSSGTNCTTRHPDVQQLKPLNHQALCPNPSQPHSLSPYSVVELIGPKLFWIARRTIVHRQRILAIQV